MWRKNRTGNGGGQSVLTEEELEKEGGGGLAGMMKKKKGKWQKREDPMEERRKNMKEIRILMPRESYEGGRHGLIPCKMDTRELQEIGERQNERKMVQEKRR